ncbi:hypothetical protein TTHERM_01170540 (macronuclear) [Tetrahymena thermophila SB210]|uniref:Kinase domain protein n=1 Tax=Tetrahymena thermophila (strain SB210) TaxID=312017 RepID=Q22PP9_TETTS|nr:hypothetical protein TTHERM_01170540 [Tetrahymena thermophila SB210]EAR87240.2 hypothetical protein TTHERM_01170540 [Tetrahymena thermophila SB210]|eukprot:XP_001007485.2 hypothetical protein TTHERM_01170540 [Tetrahymena thermophila SB210]
MAEQTNKFTSLNDFIKSDKTNFTQVQLFFADQVFDQEQFYQFASQLIVCTKIKHLQLFLKSNLNLGDEGAFELGKALSNLQELSYLKLILFQTNIGEKGFSSIGLGLSNCLLIRFLSINVSNNQIGDEGAQAISLAFRQCKNITDLRFFFNKNKVSDVGISAITQGIIHCILIESLCLSLQENNLTEEGYLILGQGIASIPKLTSFQAWIKGEYEYYLNQKEIINCKNIKELVLHLYSCNTKREKVELKIKALKIIRLVKLQVFY